MATNLPPEYFLSRVRFEFIPKSEDRRNRDEGDKKVRRLSAFRESITLLDPLLKVFNEDTKAERLKKTGSTVSDERDLRTNNTTPNGYI